MYDKTSLELLFIAIENDKNNKILNIIPKNLLKDKNFVLKVLDKNILIASVLDKNMLNDKNIIESILKNINKQDKNNKNDIVFLNSSDLSLKFYNKKETIVGEDFNFIDIPKTFIKDKETVLEILKINGEIYNILDNNFQNDKEIITETLNSKNYCILQYLNEDNKEYFSKNDDFIINEVGGNLYNVNTIEKYILEELLDGYMFLENNINLDLAKKTLNKDKIDIELAKKILNRNGMCLQYLDDFKNNRDLVLIAIKENGCSIKFASEILKNDKELVLIAIDNNIYAFDEINDKFKKDLDVLKLSLEKKPELWNNLDKKFKVFENKKYLKEKDF